MLRAPTGRFVCVSVLALALGCPAQTKPANQGEVEEEEPAPLLLRDAFGELPHVLESDRFALKWGPLGDGQVDVENGERLLEALEASFDAEVNEMGFPRPVGTDEFKMNVYVGSTGAGAPPAYGSYAYADLDPEGIPMLVYSLERIENVAKAQSSAAHELFHTVQMATESFGQEHSSWYWEATATWMAEEVFPDTFRDGYLLGLSSYAFLPHLSLAHYELPALEWELVQGHQYGAFIFQRFLTEYVVDEDFHLRTWLEGGADSDALIVLDAHLSELGTTLIEVLAHFAAHNATWDYPRRDAYVWAVTEDEVYFADQDFRVAEEVPSGGAALHAAPAATLPERAAYNLLRMREPAGDVVVRVEAAEVGSAGSPAELAVTVVRVRAGVASYQDLPLTNAVGELVVSDAALDDALFVAVAAWTPVAVEGEVFPYSYAITITP